MNLDTLHAYIEQVYEINKEFKRVIQMAADIKKIIENLVGFYDFKDRTVISVGAGGGQLVEYGRLARKIFAVDHDEKALDELKKNVEQKGLEKKFAPIRGDFYDTKLKADVVLFEFCLHEMPDPTAALKHAQSMAPEILIFDHFPGSQWAYITSEDEKVTACWLAVECFPLRKKQSFNTAQSFKNYEELYQKVRAQGERTLDRIQVFKSQTNFSIPMSYGFALL